MEVNTIYSSKMKLMVYDRGQIWFFQLPRGGGGGVELEEMTAVSLMDETNLVENPLVYTGENMEYSYSTELRAELSILSLLNLTNKSQ